MLDGQKWFCSAPMCDAFLVLAQAPARALLLLPAARAARRLAQRLPHPAAQGQARRPLERVERDRARRRAGRSSSARRAAACRRSSRWSSTRGSTASSARRPGCGRRWSRRRTTRRTARVRLAARRAAADANVLADLCVESEAATVTALRLARAYDRRAHDRPRPRSPASPRQSRSTGSASAGRAMRPRRSSASAATATSRSRACRGSTAQQPLHSIWEGSGNVVCLDASARCAGSRGRREVFLEEIRAAASRAADGARGGRACRGRGRPGEGGRRAPRPGAPGLAARAACAPAVADAFLGRARSGWATALWARRPIRPLSSSVIRR